MEINAPLVPVPSDSLFTVESRCLFIQVTLWNTKLSKTPVLRRSHLQIGINPLFQLCNMGDNSHQPSTRLQFHQRFNRVVQRLRVKASKSLVDEKGFQTDTP